MPPSLTLNKKENTIMIPYEQDMRPRAMRVYNDTYGCHFSKEMCEWAVSQMKKREDGKLVSIEPWSKDYVDSMLSAHSVKLENKKGYDYVYVANMAKADFLGSSLAGEEEVALYVKDVVDDADQSDGFIFNRFFADCMYNRIPIPWSDLI